MNNIMIFLRKKCEGLTKSRIEAYLGFICLYVLLLLVMIPHFFLS